MCGMNLFLWFFSKIWHSYEENQINLKLQFLQHYAQLDKLPFC